MRARVSAVLAGAAAGVLVVGIPAATDAAAYECQGLAATIVGPTRGVHTTGTEGNDVIVAPVADKAQIQGLGGDDTICLVGELPLSNQRPSVQVDAGPGNDTVVNQAVQLFAGVTVFLGTGADHFVGSDWSEHVYGGLESTPDDDRDLIEAAGGNDSVFVGSDSLDPAHQDAVLTGSGGDLVTYVGVGGGTLDNGTDTDGISIEGSWSGVLALDNLSGRASLDGRTTLTWTSLDAFSVAVANEGGLSYTGTDRDDLLWVQSVGRDVLAPGSILTAGGADHVRLYGYVPSAIDVGEGRDGLEMWGCQRSRIVMNRYARCDASGNRQVTTRLAGIEELHAYAAASMLVVGTPGRDRLYVGARATRVNARRGDDWVRIAAVDGRMSGGRGDDRLYSTGLETTIRGGRGDDFLRGYPQDDRLYGGPGYDTAYGHGGTDLCIAEVTKDCELP